MKKNLNYTVTFFSFLMMVFFAGCSNSETVVQSPDGNLKVKISMSSEGQPRYSIVFNDLTLLDESSLGVIMEDDDFSKALKLRGVSNPVVVSDDYQLVTGKKATHSYKSTEQSLSFINSNKQPMDVIFRVSNNGVAFRYHFPSTSDDLKKISAEATSYKFVDGTIGWLSPMAIAKSGWESTNPSYEEDYVYEIKPGTPSHLGAGWVYPALFKYNDVWMLISEADLHRNYCGTRLVAGGENEYTIGFPDPRETIFEGIVNPQSTLPWSTPWRLMAIGSLRDVVESTLGTDLAAPAINMDFSWVKPGIATWSWIIHKDNSVNYNTTRQYIDFAADMEWEYCLIDANWDRNIGYERMQELVDYAASKNVKLILWYNSAGDWNTTPYTPKSALLTRENRQAEFKRISEMGISGVKVDFFGGDGQSVIGYYQDIFEDAAKYKLTVNTHGATLPRGWQRTYPNYVTSEAVKGMEFITFTQETANNAPQHGLMQVFTRNVFDPMDYTPMNLSFIPGIKRITTASYELALSVLFTSGIQHMAESPEGMATVPGFVKGFLQDLPSQWVETRFVDGYPGKYAILARKASNGWYVAGINGEDKEQAISFNLNFMSPGSYGQLITDGEQWNAFTSEQTTTVGNLTMAPHGGFVMFFPIE